MKFSYKKLSSGISRPIIPIELKHRNESIRYEVRVDFGADLCIFDAEIGKALGLDVESGKENTVSGVTAGQAKYYIHNVTLFVGGRMHKIAAGFMPGLNTNGHGILGQKGFFDLYQVKFSYLKGEVELSEYSDKVKKRSGVR